MEEEYKPAEMELDEEVTEPPHDDSKEGQESADKFRDIVKASRRILFTAKTVFPFDLFPNTIIIDENKIDMIFCIFFYSQEVFSIPYNRVSSASSSVGLIFGSLAIEIQGYDENPPIMNRLWKHDAIKARRLINGLVTAYRQGTDLSKLDLTQVTGMVEEIGTAEPA